MGRGYPIIVSSVPKETKASYSLKDPSEVLSFLLRLSRWRKTSSLSRYSNQIWGLGDWYHRDSNVSNVKVAKAGFYSFCNPEPYSH